jgi:hypothetical protein
MARAAIDRRPELSLRVGGRVRQGPLTLPTLARIGPRLLLAVPVLFNLWTLRAETTVVQNLNDSHLHFAMVRWAQAQITAGRILPIDGWFPYLGLGSAQFRHYSALGHLIAGYVAVFVGATTTYYWSVYLLLALWPISVYFGSRLMGWDRWTAAASALSAPLLVSAMNYGYERGSYTWYGLGLWAQLWGMWLLPIALGLTWRAIRGKGSYWLAALVVSLTIAAHYFEGYLALLAIGLWAILAPSQILPRVGRAIAVGLGSLLAAAWVLVPLFQDGRWWPVSEYDRNSYFNDGFGAPKVLDWLFTGQLYDGGRAIPVVTVLVGIGVIACLVRFRRDERARAALLLWAMCLLLLCGRPTLGVLLNLLPGASVLALHRFIMGVHLSGLFLAGIGAVWLGQHLVALSRRFVPAIRPSLVAAAAAILLVLALYPAWAEIASADNAAMTTRSAQQLSDTTDGADLQVLIDYIKALSPGRVYAGARWDWGAGYSVGWVPVYTVLANQDIDTVGFRLRVPSLMSEAEMVFDERNPADYDLFGIKYLLLPADHKPPVAATLLAQQGRHTLWQLDTSGYLDVVDTVWPPVVQDHGNVATHALGFVDSALLNQHLYPTVAFNGADAAAPSLLSGATLVGPAGRVENEAVSLRDGTFNADVVANRTAVVLLKASYEPRWRVTVDGHESTPDMIAPALMGVTVPAGRHAVAFRYVPDRQYPPLLAVVLLALLGLGFGPRLIRRAWRNLPLPFRGRAGVGGAREESMEKLWTSEYRRRVEDGLQGVEGFLGLDEAWELHEEARLYPPVSERVNVVEIGSWKGRSTIALGLGVKARGNGSVAAIDPHTGSRELIEIYGPVDTYGSFLSNIERAGVADVVVPIRKTSHHARMTVEEKSVHVLFVDGSHEYEDVRQDIDDWVTALADGARVSFNDPSACGVYRALRERVLSFGSPFRSPRLIQNSVFFEFKPNTPWTARDWVAWSRLRVALILRFQANRFRPRMPSWLVRVGWTASRRMVGG